MGAIIGFSSPLVRPWWDLWRLPTPRLAQEGGRLAPWVSAHKWGKSPAALMPSTPIPQGSWFRRHDPCSGPWGSGLTAHLAGLGRVPGPVLGAGAGAACVEASWGTGPLQILPPACVFPTPLSQARGQGGPSPDPRLSAKHHPPLPCECY